MEKEIEYYRISMNEWKNHVDNLMPDKLFSKATMDLFLHDDSKGIIVLTTYKLYQIYIIICIIFHIRYRNSIYNKL